MEAAFDKYPVGRLEGKGTQLSRAVFAAPPTGYRRLKVAYHNFFVDMCRVTARKFSTILAEGSGE